MNKNRQVIIIVLVIVAIVLGFMIVSKQEQDKPQSTIDNLAGNEPDTAPALSQLPESVSTDDRRRLVGELTSDELAAIEHPGPEATEEELQQHFKLIERTAQYAQFLYVLDCFVSPVVLHVNEGAPISVRNLDTVSHELILDSENIFSIPAGEVIEITADFGKSAGVYGYGCDTQEGAVGIIFMTN